jgi:hypothetical protein
MPPKLLIRPKLNHRSFGLFFAGTMDKTLIRYMKFPESSNHRQNQGISQISLSDEYSKSQLDVKLGFWHLCIPNLKNFPPI